MRRIFIAFATLVVLIVAAIIFLADRSGLPSWITMLYAFPYGDKVGHFCLMGLLSFAVNLALRARAVSIAGRRLLLGSLAVAAVITLEEFSQLFFSTRTFDLLDLTASLLGIVVFGRLAWLAVPHPPQETRS